MREGADSRRSLSVALRNALDAQRLRFLQDASTRVEDILALHPPIDANPDAVLDLIDREIQLRREVGEHPSLEEYIGRFPHLSEQLPSLFHRNTADQSAQFQSTVNKSAIDSSIVMAKEAIAPTTIPGYEILEELGRGGMGVVYRARQLKLNRIVALKMVLAGRHASADSLARFQREAEAVARVQHPNIVQIFEVGEFQGCPFLSLEYVAGGPLSRRLTGTPWDENQAASLVVNLAHAVHVTHVAGIIHRDLKPANILLKEFESSSSETLPPSSQGQGEVEVTVSYGPVVRTETAVPKITDFGLARTGEENDHQTQSGAFLGTPSYCSPEQAAGETSSIGPPTDVYSLGAILYELLTGRPPFKGATLLETLQQVANQEPAPPRMLNPKVSRDLETICLKCLSKRDSDRYPTGLALAEDLTRFQRKEPILARPAGAIERCGKWIRRRPASAALLLLSSLSLLAAVGIVVALSYQNQLQAKNQQLVEAVASAEQASTEAQWRRTEAEAQRDLVADGRLQLEARSKELELERDRGKIYLYNADMNLAERAWEEHRVARMMKLLNRQHPSQTGKDYRSFEWYYLHGLERQESQRIAGSQLAVTPNRKHFAVAFNRIVSIYDSHTMMITRPLLHSTGQISCIAISDDGRLVAAGGWDKTIHVWDSVGAEKIATLTVPKYLTHLAFSPDGKRLVSSQQSNIVRIWDLATGEETGSYTDHRHNTNTVAFTPDGDWIVSGASDQSVVARSLVENQMNRVSPNLPEAIWEFAFHPSGDQIAVGSQREPISFFESTSLKRLPSPGGGKYYGMYLGFSPDGEHLVTGSEEGLVRIWDLQSGELEQTFVGHQGSVTKVTFVTNDRVISAGIDSTIRVWDRTADPMPRTLRGHSQRISALAFSADGMTLASASWDGTIKLWPREGQPKTLFGHTNSISDLAYHPTAAQIASCSSDGTTRVWDATTGRQILLMEGHVGTVSEVAYSLDGALIATVGSDKTARLWDSKTGKIVHVLEGHTDMIYTVAFHPEGKLLATGSQDGGIRLWDVESGEQTGFIAEGNNSGLAFSPDGKTLAVAIGVVFRLHDVDSRQFLYQSDQHQSIVTNVAYTPDGKRLVTTHYENLVKFWDVVSHRETLTLRDHGSSVTALAISRDGKQLATGDLHEIKVWDIAGSYSD